MLSSRRLASLLTLVVLLSAAESFRIRRQNETAQAVLSETSVVTRHGRLRVNGNKIVDKTGAPVRLRGMSLFWSQWQPQYWNANTVKWLKKDWQMDLIRAAMGIEHGGYLDNSGAEKGRMEAVVDAAIAAGIYVVIDWHDHNAEQHAGQAKGFFEEMARKYGRYPNVLFELFNEPTQQSWSGTIKPYHESVIPVIRQHTKNIIILGTRTWSQEVDDACRDRVQGENLAYTVHFYANTHRQGLRNRVSSALSSGCAIFATEWGTCDASGDGSLDFGETQAWLNFFKEHHISDANWAVSDKSEACSALRPGASGNGGWSEGQLTESGRFVRNSMRAESRRRESTTRRRRSTTRRRRSSTIRRRRSSTIRRRRSSTIRRRRTGTTRRRRSSTRRRRTSSGSGCCKWGGQCGDCGDDGTGWCHKSSSNCASCTGSFDASAMAPSCR